MESITGLSASTLELVIIGLAVAYLLVAFFQDRAKKGSRLARVLDLVRKAIPFIEGAARRERDKAKAMEAKALPRPPGALDTEGAQAPSEKSP
jgi:hypothetical protein